MRIKQFNPSDTVSEFNRYYRATPGIVKTYSLKLKIMQPIVNAITHSIA